MHKNTPDIREQVALFLPKMNYSSMKVHVIGESMRPTLVPGDKLTVCRGVYLPGDIIVFKYGGGLYVHRLVGYWINTRSLVAIAKGDNRNGLENNVPFHTIVGKVKSWERNGTLYYESLLIKWQKWIKNVIGYAITRLSLNTDR